MHRTVAFVFALLASTAALAQGAAEPAKLMPGALTAYSEYDANGDGVVALAEIEALITPDLIAGVRSCDSNGDKILAQAEYDLCNGMPAPSETPAPR